MRLWILGLAMLCASTTARCEDITEVLYRSQEQRLQSLQTVSPDDARAQTIRRSFERLLTLLEPRGDVELRVVSGDIIAAETLHGHIVLAQVDLADFPEGERLFILAHEIGHIVRGHWSQMGMVYLKHIPGALEQEPSAAVSSQLATDASALSHRQEFEADAYGVHALRRLGYTDEDALAAFLRLGTRGDTPTHPGTRKRVANLRIVDEPR